MFNFENNVEEKIALEYLEELVVKVESLFKRARLNALAFKSSEVSGAGLDSYGNVFKMLWATDMEIAELRATLPKGLQDISDIRSDTAENKKMVDSQANIVPVSELKNNKVKD